MFDRDDGTWPRQRIAMHDEGLALGIDYHEEDSLHRSPVAFH
jgi:hypothetical protein